MKVEQLIERLFSHQDPECRQEVVNILVNIGEDATSILTKLLHHDDAIVL